MSKRLIFLLLCLSLVFPFPLAAQEVFDVAERIIVVLWHGSRLEELAALDFGQKGAWSLLNVRGGGGHAPSAAYLSISSGARAVGHEQAAAFLAGAEAQALYQLHTGFNAAPLVNPAIAQILAAQQVNYTVEPGALGSVLKEKNIPILVLGSSDGDKLARWGAVVGMDKGGRVWQGVVGDKLLLADSEYPFGLKTDYQLMAELINQGEEGLVIVDLGDPYRLELYQDNLLPGQKDKLRRQMLHEVADFLQNLLAKAKPGTVLAIISPYPDRERAEQGRWLTPVLLLGLGEGLLVSGTTRWPGLITNMDIGPTLLSLLGVEHEQTFIGRKGKFVPQTNAKGKVLALQNRIFAVAEHRSLVLKLVIFGQIFLYSSVLVSLIVQNTFFRRIAIYLQKLLLLFLLLPVLLLLFSRIISVVVALMLCAFLVLKNQADPLWKVGVIAGITALLLAIDLFLQNKLIRFSYLGYDPIGGARFYGLGNEYMGIFIGAVVMCWTIFTHYTKIAGNFRAGLGLIVFSAALILIGAPSLGTNVGGAIAAVFAFGSVWLAGRQTKICWQHGVYLVIAVALVLVILVAVDSKNPDSVQSHIGQTAQLFSRDGFHALQQIIVRKLTMNLKLLRYSLWSRALLVAIGAMGASFIWPTSFIFWLRKTYPLPAKGIGSIVIGSLAALIFNDSGVVAAATCLYFGSTTLLLLALELKHDLGPSQADI